MAAVTWTDLVDPSESELRPHLPRAVEESVVAELLRPATAAGGVRPTLRSHGDYVFGALLAAVAVPAEDRVYYQEIALVLTQTAVLTVRKTPPGETPFDVSDVRAVCDRAK